MTIGPQTTLGTPRSNHGDVEGIVAKRPREYLLQREKLRCIPQPVGENGFVRHGPEPSNCHDPSNRTWIPSVATGFHQFDDQVVGVGHTDGPPAGTTFPEPPRRNLDMRGVENLHPDLFQPSQGRGEIVRDLPNAQGFVIRPGNWEATISATKV